jgi:predicted DCC family thiol-disulfide oxidoreductase YuxK
MYDAFIKRRYRWFGKQDTCVVPSPEIRERFIV